MKTRPESQVEIQERGEIYFFYRPKVNKEEVHSVDDVQRLYIILHPQSADAGDSHNIEEQSLFRFIVMGRKSLPNPTQKTRPYWGFVQMVTTNVEHVKNSLRGGEYETSTRGKRHTGAARAAGEGIYRILRHKPDNKGGVERRKTTHTHLIYKLEFPGKDEKNEPQESFNIERKGSFIIQIKNPERASDQDNDLGKNKKRRATFPAHLQGQLGHAKFAPADPPDYLNYEGCEFLLISSSDRIEDELGLELRTGEEEQDASCSNLLNTFGDTVAAASNSFLKGTWV